MGNVMFMRKGEVHTAPVKPITDVPLGSLVEGQIVMINENGSPVPFYIAKHDYESGLNGTGRTLMARVKRLGPRQWHSSAVNAYATSDIDSWLNTDYQPTLDAAVRTAMGTTKFYYTPGNGNTSITTLSRSVFLLSGTECGGSRDNMNVEGSKLPIATKGEFQNAGWTRTPLITDTTTVQVISINDYGVVSSYVTQSMFYVNPAFTLPSTMLTTANDDGTVTLKV